MKLFLKRLFKTFGNITYCLIAVAVYLGIVFVIFNDNPTIKIIVNIIEWIIIIPVALVLLFAIGYFIYWLFVEPFRKISK